MPRRRVASSNPGGTDGEAQNMGPAQHGCLSTSQELPARYGAQGCTQGGRDGAAHAAKQKDIAGADIRVREEAELGSQPRRCREVAVKRRACPVAERRRAWPDLMRGRGSVAVPVEDDHGPRKEGRCRPPSPLWE
jgi:hypothetical protein